MGLFHKKSKFERIVEPLSHVQPTRAVKSGAKAAGMLVGMSLLSTMVSMLRQRRETS